MSRNILAIFVAVFAIVAVFVGCSTDNSTVPTDWSADLTPPDGSVNATASIGEVHNEFLELCDRYDDKLHPIDAALRASNELCAKYGEQPYTREQIEQFISEGEQKVEMTTEEMARLVLGGEELDWFLEFIDNATPETVERDLKVFKKRGPMPYVAADRGSSPGPFAQGAERIQREPTVLEDVVEVVVASSQHWHQKRKDYEMACVDPNIGEHGGGGGDPQSSGTPWWKRVIRFATVVAADGVCGGLASGSGPVGAGIVGGLGSYGADHLIFDGRDDW